MLNGTPYKGALDCMKRIRAEQGGYRALWRSNVSRVMLSANYNTFGNFWLYDSIMKENTYEKNSPMYLGASIVAGGLAGGLAGMLS